MDERHRLCLWCCGMGSSGFMKNYMKHDVDATVVFGTNLYGFEDRHMCFHERFVRLILVKRCFEAFSRNVPTVVGSVADIGSFSVLNFRNVSSKTKSAMREYLT